MGINKLFFIGWISIVVCFIFLPVTHSEPAVPVSCVVVNEDNPFVHQFTTGLSAGEAFTSVYAGVQDSYHSQINTLFNAEIGKLTSGLSVQSEDMCKPFNVEKETHALVVSVQARTLLNQYECALTEYIENPPLIGSALFHIQAVENLQSIQTELQTEIIKSYKAIELTIQMYSEMRRWYPVHRDLQCLISQMELYRDALRGFIDQVTRLPAKFYNYGSTHQH